MALAVAMLGVKPENQQQIIIAAASYNTTEGRSSVLCVHDEKLENTLFNFEMFAPQQKLGNC
jgi:hypothetical protein